MEDILSSPRSKRLIAGHLDYKGIHQLQMLQSIAADADLHMVKTHIAMRTTPYMYVCTYLPDKVNEYLLTY